MFLSSPHVWWYPFSVFPSICRFPFSPNVSILCWFVCSIPSVMDHSPLFIISITHFSLPDSIPISWLYIHTGGIRFSNSFTFLVNDLWSFYPTVHILGMGLSGIIAIKNGNGNIASPWMITLLIFTSDKLFPLAISSTLQYPQVFVVFLFLRTFWFCIDLVVPFHPSWIISRFSLQVWQIPNLYLDWIFTLPVLCFPILSHFNKQFDVVHVL